MNERKLISRRGVFALLALLVLCLALFLLYRFLPGGTVAIVEKNGEEVLRQELSQLTAEKTVTVEGENDITLTVAFYPDGAAVLSSECPDKICVNKGKLTRGGEAAICLPAKVSLRLEGGPSDDAATY